LHSVELRDPIKEEKIKGKPKTSLLDSYLKGIEPGVKNLNYIEKPEKSQRSKGEKEKKERILDFTKKTSSLYLYIGIGAALGLAILVIFLILRKKKKEEKQDGNGHIPGRRWAKG